MIEGFTAPLPHPTPAITTYTTHSSVGDSGEEVFNSCLQWNGEVWRIRQTIDSQAKAHHRKTHTIRF